MTDAVRDGRHLMNTISAYGVVPSGDLVSVDVVSTPGYSAFYTVCACGRHFYGNGRRYDLEMARLERHTAKCHACRDEAPR